MNELQIFKNNQFGNVRIVMKDQEPWFVAKDVCNCLEINNSRQALIRLDDDEKSSVILNDGILSLSLVCICTKFVQSYEKQYKSVQQKRATHTDSPLFVR